MLNTVLTRYRVWQLKLDTIRYLSACDNRMLADMGIARGDIAKIAARNARTDKRLQAPPAPASAGHRTACTAV